MNNDEYMQFDKPKNQRQQSLSHTGQQIVRKWQEHIKNCVTVESVRAEFYSCIFIIDGLFPSKNDWREAFVILTNTAFDRCEEIAKLNKE